MNKLLDIRHLSIHYQTKGEIFQAVRDVSLAIQPQETVGIVGESGCGKSTLAYSILRLLPPQASILSGEMLWEGSNLLTVSEARIRAVRGREITMIFQDPFTSLNPVFTIGEQIAEVFIQHEKLAKKIAWEKAIDMLKQVQIPEPEKRARRYPHEFSGGMRQRAMIAMALAMKPKLLIADEPTTALDVTTQIQILKLIRSLQNKLNMAVLFITHNLGIVSELCDRVLVMYAGEVVEQGDVYSLFKQPLHPYTQGLLAALPNPETGFPKGIPGRPPHLNQLPAGCPYEPRCPIRVAECHPLHPPLEEKKQDHLARCLKVEPKSIINANNQ